MSWLSSLFGGGGDGGSSGGGFDDVPAQPPPWAQNYGTVSNESQPGQIAGLASNLAAGGFGSGSAPDLQNWMNTFYKPGPMLQYGAPPPPPPPPPAAAAPIAPSAAPRAPTPAREWNYRHRATTGDGEDVWAFGGGAHSR